MSFVTAFKIVHVKLIILVCLKASIGQDVNVRVKQGTLLGVSFLDT